MATLTKTARTLIAAGTANAAGSSTRGAVGGVGSAGLTTALGGRLTVKLANGASGPTVGATVNVLIAHQATCPALAAAGADWKTLYSVQHVTTANAVGEWSWPIDEGVMQLAVEITGNTGQPVTAEAFFSEATSIG